MKVVCAWCGVTISQPGVWVSLEQFPLVSHGICTSCKAKVLAEIEGSELQR